ncbi:MAG TPA: glycosyltransferase family 1 protein [Acidobacteria bacterium]|nr:glycosyltransferase family 1 protein [Acidobacteriota bacterium]
MFSLHVDTARTWRGGQNQALLTVLGLRAQGHRTALVAHPDGELRRRASEGPDLIPIASSGDMDLRAAWKLSRVLRMMRPTVVHAHDAHAVTMVALARSLGRLEPPPPILMSRRVDFHIRRNAFSRWKYGQIDRFLCASDAIRAMLVGDGIAAERTTTVHDGVDLDHVAATPRLDAHAELWLPSGAPLVGNVAALVPHKGHRYLITAAAIVIRSVPDARFVIVGEGELETKLRKQIRDLHLERHVLLAGFRPDALSLQKGFDLFALSSVTEGMGSVLLDAMAIGQATVATRAGGIPEVVVDGRTGVLVPVRDAPALASAIVSLLGDPDRRARLGAAARARVLESFSVERMVQRVLDSYARLAGTRPATGTGDHPGAD